MTNVWFISFDEIRVEADDEADAIEKAREIVFKEVI